MTKLSDTKKTVKVASSCKTVPTTTAPLVGNVSAGSAGSAVSAPSAILLLMQHLVKAGDTCPINREDVGPFLKTAHTAEVNEPEGDLLDYLRNGGQICSTFDEPDYIEDFIADEAPGDDPAALNLLQEYYQWRAARRHFCGQLRQYIAAMDADEARRDQAEAELLAALSVASASEASEVTL
ncbi:MAG: hypothetical protein V4671_23825 [Armatimonadota bacterium]